MRAIFALAGIAMLVAGGKMGLDFSRGEYPVAYRWSVYNRSLSEFGRSQHYEEGEALAGTALKEFPLHPDAHYWNLAFTEATGEELEDIIAAGRRVEPVQPRTALGQAALWKDVDPAREAEAWGEAVRRARLLDLIEGKVELPTAGTHLQNGLASLHAKPEAQQLLLQQVGGDPILTAYWVRSAAPELVAVWVAHLPDAGFWLDGLPGNLRGMVLERLIAFPDPSAAVSYMEARSVAAPGLYWRQLAKWYAAKGDKPGAVALVAAANGVALDGAAPDGELWRQLSDLRGQGNDVAVRRLVKEAVSAPKADADKLTAAMVWAARAGDWEMAWQAASRLATVRKNGQ